MSPKRHCKNPAAWRLLRAKPAEQLSAYYGFRCEYGTSLMTFWQGGSTNPIYLCNDHARALAPRQVHEGVQFGNAKTA